MHDTLDKVVKMQSSVESVGKNVDRLSSDVHTVLQLAGAQADTLTMLMQKQGKTPHGGGYVNSRHNKSF